MPVDGREDLLGHVVAQARSHREVGAEPLRGVAVRNAGTLRPGPSTGPSRRRRLPARGLACRGGGNHGAGRPTTRCSRAAPRPGRSAPSCHPAGLPATPGRTSAPTRAGPWGAHRRPTRSRSHGPTGRGVGRRHGRRSTAASAGSPSRVTGRQRRRGTAPARVRSLRTTARAGRAAAPPRSSGTGGTTAEGSSRRPLSLAGLVVDTAVIHTGRDDLDRAGGGDHGPAPVGTVADHQAPPMPVILGRQLGYVLVDFRFQRGGEHPACTLAHDLVDQGAGPGGTVGGDYAEHGRAFPTCAATRAYSMTITGSFGNVRPFVFLPEPIHKP